MLGPSDTGQNELRLPQIAHIHNTYVRSSQKIKTEIFSPTILKAFPT
jgi:hypothetical protein